MLPLPYKGDQCKPFHFMPHSQSCAFSHKTALTPSWISAHSPSISYPAYFLPSFRAFLNGDYPKEMLPVLCWRAEIWTQPIVVEQVRHCWPCLLTRTTDPGTETRYKHPPPGPGQLKGQVWDYLLSLAPLVADWPCSVSRQPEAETIWTALVGFPDDWLSLPLTTVSPGKVRRLTVDSQGAETIPLVSCLAQRLSHQEPLMGICWTFNWLSSLVLFRFSCPLTQPSGLSVISPSTRFRSRFVKSPTLWSLIGHLFLLATFCCCFWRGIQIFK